MMIALCIKQLSRSRTAVNIHHIMYCKEIYYGRLSDQRRRNRGN